VHNTSGDDDDNIHKIINTSPNVNNKYWLGRGKPGVYLQALLSIWTTCKYCKKQIKLPGRVENEHYRTNAV